MMGFAIIGMVAPIVMTALCWALFRKAGFRGAILAVTLLPLAGLLTSTLLNVLFGMVDVGEMGLFLISSLFGSAVFVAPLVVLLMKKWPLGGEDDVFR